MRFLFFLFIAMPILEITLLIQVGQLIGVWYTVGLVLLSAFIGVNMLRHQGLSTLLRARSRLEGGELPADEMLEGLLLAVGGALLLTPGFVTDLIGFSCLVPVSRRALVRLVRSRVQLVGFASHTRPSDPFAAGADPRRSPGESAKSGDVIDGEYRRED